jgi:purine nucleosidase
MKRFIIDTDPGVDDAHAIMMALAHPEARVEAITTVAGNVDLERTTANACKILDVFEANIPIYPGCSSALIGIGNKDAAEFHGEDGLGDCGYPASERRVEVEHASAALVRLANDSPGELSLIAIGPLTNLAVALKLDPNLPGKFKELFIMGGAIYARGNTPNMSAEFNIFADPEAAHIVFGAWPQFTLVSWETTMAHSFSPETVQRWLAMETARGQFFQRITKNVIGILEGIFGQPVLLGADALAMAVLLEPDIVQKADQHYLTVELNGRTTRGQTVVDWMDRGGQPANANIVLEVDQARFEELLEMGLK